VDEIRARSPAVDARAFLGTRPGARNDGALPLHDHPWTTREDVEHTIKRPARLGEGAL
jgi:hypothetical protein